MGLPDGVFGAEALPQAKQGADAFCAGPVADGRRWGRSGADPPKGKRAACPYFSLSTKPSTKRFCKSAMTRSGGIKAKAQVAMTAP